MDEKKILYIEDDTDNHFALEMILLNSQFQLTCLTSGEEGIDFVRKLKPDLVLIDISLSTGMDGYEVMRQIRLSEVSDTPIVALTGHAVESERKKCFEAGCNGFISKPIDASSFEKEIMTYFRN
ncbi:MAG: response regulator [Candidatus Margulisbacteria bacterium]|nr:response regulator [Candidatus Margulisiibacteriota bacterium]